jgi:hypothetical protein
LKRIILLAAALTALAFVPTATAQASVTATCTEHAFGPGPVLLNGDWLMRGQGTITCTANTGPIEVNVRLIRNGVLLPVGTTTCSFDNYCSKFVYDSHLTGCFKTRAWGFIGPDRNPTGATTSAEACY